MYKVWQITATITANCIMSRWPWAKTHFLSILAYVKGFITNQCLLWWKRKVPVENLVLYCSKHNLADFSPAAPELLLHLCASPLGPSCFPCFPCLPCLCGHYGFEVPLSALAAINTSLERSTGHFWHIHHAGAFRQGPPWAPRCSYVC